MVYICLWWKSISDAKRFYTWPHCYIPDTHCANGFTANLKTTSLYYYFYYYRYRFYYSQLALPLLSRLYLIPVSTGRRFPFEPPEVLLSEFSIKQHRALVLLPSSIHPTVFPLHNFCCWYFLFFIHCSRNHSLLYSLINISQRNTICGFLTPTRHSTLLKHFQRSPFFNTRGKSWFLLFNVIYKIRSSSFPIPSLPFSRVDSFLKS